MAQRYIPAIVNGDKRIFLIGGEPVPYVLARLPSAGETRANLAVGGQGVAQPLSAHDEKLARTVAARLLGDPSSGQAGATSYHPAGLLLIGLDVIGDYLTEISMTSPTCFVEIAAQTGFNVADMFVRALERAVHA
jgi:glutathione synthase